MRAYENCRNEEPNGIKHRSARKVSQSPQQKTIATSGLVVQSNAPRCGWRNRLDSTTDAARAPGLFQPGPTIVKFVTDCGKSEELELLWNVRGWQYFPNRV